MPKPTLLYAEDDVETRENYAYVLKSFFSEVYTAGDGEEALALYHEKNPDMLLLDISMPLLDGLEMTKIIRAIDLKTPITMLTAHSDQEKLLKAMPLGLTEYLLKPVDDTVLLKTMEKMIGKVKNIQYVYLKEACVWHKRDSELSCKKKSIALTKKETILLKLLITSIGHYVSKDMLIMDIWCEESYSESHDNKLIQLVYRLNKKIALATGDQTSFIENSYALGYRVLSH